MIMRIKKLAALALLSASPLATADEFQLAWCHEAYNAAYIIMSQRQGNDSMPEMISAARTLQNPDARLQVSYMIFDAFNHAGYMTPKHRERVSREYANKMYYKCIRKQGIFELQDSGSR